MEIKEPNANIMIYSYIWLPPIVSYYSLGLDISI